MKNKFAFSIGRLMASLCLIGLILFQSCKKDTIYPIDNSVRLDKQLIAQSEMQEWFRTNPAGQLLSPDWKKAKQAIYNPNEYYGSLADQNLAKIFLGSFMTDSYVISKAANSATILFKVANVSGWESATRFIKAEGGNLGIMDNKDRGSGLNLGGNFSQDIQWTEIISW